LPQRGDDSAIYNAAVLLDKGQITGQAHKMALPNYDVFDEKRNYRAGGIATPIEFRGHKLGVLICEDLWTQEVAAQLAAQGAEALISMNASPYETGKLKRRLEDVIGQRVDETGLPVLYVNQVGGQDEVVFDGHSCAVNSDGTLAFMAAGFEESYNMLTLTKDAQGAAFAPATIAYEHMAGSAEEHDLAQDWQALVLAVRDYFAKEGFQKAILGMSGGIDSAAVAALAVDALGPENVRLYRLPSKFTSDMSNDDADEAARMMGCAIDAVPIAPMHEAVKDALADRFDAAAADGREAYKKVTDENIQARVRGLTLMALSNLGEGLLLTTGNKSEISVGFFTLYGDSSGGFAPIRDVWKTRVYDLAAWRNNNFPPGALGPDGPVMPENIITRPPSAELADDQEDTDFLPPYEVLDPILKMFIEDDMALADIATATDQPRELIDRVANLVGNAEFKRRQAPIGPKITKRSYGKGWRQPLAQPTLPQAMKELRLNR